MPAALIELLVALERSLERGEPVALATLVGVRGSAPWRPGARLLATAGGGMIGAVSGGCVESDVFERAGAAMRSGRVTVATYGVADELAVEVGTNCGSIDVLIDPCADAGSARLVWAALREALCRRRGASVVTALAPDRLLGRTLFVAAEDTGLSGVVGSIAPDLDAELVAEARGAAACGAETRGARQWSTAWRGEEAVFFVEAFPPAPRLFLVGATSTASALCPMAKTVGFHVSVVDPRSLYATAERFPDADEFLRAWPQEAFEAAGLDAASFVVVLAHDPKFDLPALSCALRSPAAYVGALGSRRTHARRVEKLRAQGFAEADLARVHAPIGLDLGARTPEEIAVAVIAEILAVRSGRVVGSLRDGTGSINASSAPPPVAQAGAR